MSDQELLQVLHEMKYGTSQIIKVIDITLIKNKKKINKQKNFLNETNRDLSIMIRKIDILSNKIKNEEIEEDQINEEIETLYDYWEQLDRNKIKEIAKIIDIL
jgi:hypothetical protein